MTDFTKSKTAYCKGIALLLMFTHHLFAFPERIRYPYYSIYQLYNVPIEVYIGEFGKICVAIFMCLSGYGLYSLFCFTDNYESKVIEKLNFLFHHYHQVFVIFIGLGVLLSYPRDYNIVPLILNWLAIKTSYNGEWWFLTPYIILVLCSGVIFKLFRKTKSIIYDFLIVIFIAELIRWLLPIIRDLKVLDNFVQSNSGQISIKTLQQLPNFLIGIIAAKHNLFAYYLTKMGSSKFPVAISTICILLIVAFRHYAIKQFDYLLAPAFIVPCTYLCDLSPSILKKILKELGQYSTYMWLIHSFFCYQYFQPFIFIPKYSVLILLNLIIVSYVSAKMLEKIFNRKYIERNPKAC